MIELYGMSSPNVLKVVLMLEELELPYRQHHVAVTRAEQFSPEFLALNPLGRVPVITDPAPGSADSDDHVTVFESGAILIYLAEKHASPLLPREGPARYRVLEWLMLQMANVGPMLGQLNHFLLMPAEVSGYGLSRYRDQARRLYRVLDDRLASAPWLAGDAYSIADIATWPWARYVDLHSLSWSDYPALRRWVDVIEARPAAERAERAMTRFAPDDKAAIGDATPEQLDRFFWRESPGPAPDFRAVANQPNRRFDDEK